tara:strand:+ start:731 stop:943 length:213 start_codon:yes stop_codon:yes gene_type:complete
MEAYGVPSSLIITEPFAPIVAAFAPTVGMAEYASTIMVPHRVATMDDDDLRKLADSVVDEVIACLTINHR